MGFKFITEFASSYKNKMYTIAWISLFCLSIPSNIYWIWKKTLHITGIKQNLTIIQREENLPKPISNVSSWNGNYQSITCQLKEKWKVFIQK